MSERETHCRVRLADPDGLLGMLQRGRGRGYLNALDATPETIWPLLAECVAEDPRWDKDVEDRAEYYASLILVTGMDPEPLHSHLRRCAGREQNWGWRVSLSLETLVALAERGSDQAVHILRDYIGFGMDWAWVTMFLSQIASPATLDGIDEVLCRRFDSDERFRERFAEQMEDACRWFYGLYQKSSPESARLPPLLREPWKTLRARNRALDDLLDKLELPGQEAASPERQMAKEDVTNLSVPELLASVGQSSFWPSAGVLPERVSIDNETLLVESLLSENKYSVMLALRGLGHLGTPRAFGAVKSFIENNQRDNRGVLRHAFEAIAEMPASLTLDTARAWFLRQEWSLQRAGGEILESHATLDDIPLLIETLRRPETIRCQDTRLSTALDALAQFEGIGPIPELEEVFRRVGHGFQRCRAADAMAATGPVHFAAEYAYECLWDCHSDTRELGCEMVNLAAPGALERLRELAADPNESDSVREKAQERLEGF